MSVALFIVAEREIDGFDPFVNGKAIGRANENVMRQLCRTLDIRPLEEFISQDTDELKDFLEDAGVDIPDDLPAPRWFEASEGLRTVRALISHLRANPQAIKQADAIVEDLQEYEAVLARLEQERVRWHFQVDY